MLVFYSEPVAHFDPPIISIRFKFDLLAGSQTLVDLVIDLGRDVEVCALNPLENQAVGSKNM